MVENPILMGRVENLDNSNGILRFQALVKSLSGSANFDNYLDRSRSEFGSEFGNLTGSLFQLLVDDLLPLNFPGCTVLPEWKISRSLRRIEEATGTYLSVTSNSFRVHSELITIPDDLIIEPKKNDQYKVRHLVETTLKPSPPKHLNIRFGRVNAIKRLIFYLEHDPDVKSLYEQTISLELGQTISLLSLRGETEIYLKVLPIENKSETFLKKRGIMYAPFTREEIRELTWKILSEVNIHPR